MKLFKLPDLGEGLPDAIVREWYVKVGDEIKTDQPMVAMETAKALVDSGMSRRKTAEALGVSHATINADVGNGKKSSKTNVRFSGNK